MLKESQRPSAPPDILSAVMAKIAAERAERGGVDARGVERPRAARRVRKAFSPVYRLELGPTLCALALLCGWLGFMSASQWLVGYLYAVPAVVDGAMSIVRLYASQTMALVHLGYAALPEGLAPYVTAFFWSVVGIGVWLLIPIFVREPVRR